MNADLKTKQHTTIISQRNLILFGVLVTKYNFVHFVRSLELFLILSYWTVGMTFYIDLTLIRFF